MAHMLSVVDPGCALISRRACVGLVPVGAAAMLGVRVSAEQPAASAPAGVSDSFPAQDRALVREIVGASHGNIERVGALLKDVPRLANAAYDWGFGDWETALGAASHTGRREIAAMLLEHGARPDIFCAAMLGQLEVVKAMIAARPGLQRTRGPHGLTLLHHARAGGEASGAVAEYLTSLGDADIAYPEQPLPAEQRERYVGDYAYGARADQRFSIVVLDKQERLGIKRGSDFPRALFHLGNNTFHPAGAPDVAIAFTVQNGKATGVSITTPAALLTATRA